MICREMKMMRINDVHTQKVTHFYQSRDARLWRHTFQKRKRLRSVLLRVYVNLAHVIRSSARKKAIFHQVGFRTLFLFFSRRIILTAYMHDHKTKITSLDRC